MKTPFFWYKNKSIFSLMLFPLSLLWLFSSFLISILKKQNSFQIPIICVGNVIAGGSGKTPLVIEICKHFKKKNIAIHVVYKAYKININEKFIKVNKKFFNNAEDEAILISNYATTWICKKRKFGIDAAIKSGAQLVLLDDGLQDNSIVKNFNILVSISSSKFL